MPIFEYRCPACDKAFERIQRRDDTSPVPCPACGATSERQFSAFAMHVAGPSFGSCATRDACAGPSPSGGCGCSGGSCPH